MKLWKCLGLRRSFLTVSISSSSLPLSSQLRNGFYVNWSAYWYFSLHALFWLSLGECDEGARNEDDRREAEARF